MNKNWISPAKLMLLGTVLASAVSFSSCDKNDDNNQNNMYTVSGSGTSAQVVPAFTGTATGSITGTYDAESNRLDYNVGWNGLTDTAGTVALYAGASGTAGMQSQLLNVSAQGQTGNSTGYMTLTELQENELLNGNWYYSVGTLANLNGEVRGQITATK